MIKIKVKTKNGVIEQIVISGHAHYDESGKDIVCAAVSATVFTTVNAIHRIDHQSIKYDEKDNMLVIIFKKHTKVIDIIIKNMLSMLSALEKDYSKYIKINEEV